MAILHKTFLHDPARSPALVDEYVNHHREEDEQLDFKAIAWKKGESLEAAKDVASFANHLGGDIIIGINDTGDRADGWCPISNADIPTTIRNIRDWLIKHIRPEEFAEIVDIEQIATPQPNSSVLVISVPPFHQLVGIEDRETDKLAFQFPIRTGRRTRWLTFDEVMRKASETTRGTYIKLKALKDSFGIGAVPVIGFTSPVLIRAGDELKPVPVEAGTHCALRNLTPDIITAEMFGSKGFVTGEIRHKNHLVQSNPVSVPSGHELNIPLEFIRAAWTDKKTSLQGEFIFIALDVAIFWNDESWELVTGPFPR